MYNSVTKMYKRSNFLEFDMIFFINDLGNFRDDITEYIKNISKSSN